LTKYFALSDPPFRTPGKKKRKKEDVQIFTEIYHGMQISPLQIFLHAFTHTKEKDFTVTPCCGLSFWSCWLVVRHMLQVY
jgi:hypothetical protein